MTQGRGDGSEWVTEYLVSYSPDGEQWNYVTDNSEIARVSPCHITPYINSVVYQIKSRDPLPLIKF